MDFTRGNGSDTDRRHSCPSSCRSESQADLGQACLLSLDVKNGSAGFTGLLAIGTGTQLPNRNWWRHIHYFAMYRALGWSFDGVRFGPNATTEG